MDVGEVYLVLLRPSRVPVAGEALCNGFQGQVELHDWRWCLNNAQELKRMDSADGRFRKAESRLVRDRSMQVRDEEVKQDYYRRVERLERRLKAGADEETVGEIRTALNDLKENLHKRRHEAVTGKQWRSAKMTDKERQQLADDKEDSRAAKASNAAIEEAERNKNFQFRFRKRVDLATTQLLNSMKLGDVFSSGTLTIHQRSVNSGMTLVLNLQKVRLLEYGVSVQVSETMTDMVETWTAEFDAMSYVYKNRNAIGSSTNALQAGMKAATQGTVRTFAMHNVSLSV